MDVQTFSNYWRRQLNEHEQHQLAMKESEELELAKGEKLGLAKGRQLQKEDMVRKMVSKGLSCAEISDLLGLSEEEIRKITGTEETSENS